MYILAFGCLVLHTFFTSCPRDVRILDLYSLRRLRIFPLPIKESKLSDLGPFPQPHPQPHWPLPLSHYDTYMCWKSHHSIAIFHFKGEEKQTWIFTQGITSLLPPGVAAHQPGAPTPFLCEGLQVVDPLSFPSSGIISIYLHSRKKQSPEMELWPDRAFLSALRDVARRRLAFAVSDSKRQASESSFRGCDVLFFSSCFQDVFFGFQESGYYVSQCGFL